MKFHEILNDLLKERGWEALDLQVALRDKGVTCSLFTVKNWLAGEFDPRREALDGIYKIFGTTRFFPEPTITVAE